MGQNPTEIQAFTNSQFGKIRAIEKDGEIGFFGSDLCNILGTATKELKSILDSDQFVNVDSIHIGRKQLFVNSKLNLVFYFINDMLKYIIVICFNIDKEVNNDYIPV